MGDMAEVYKEWKELKKISKLDSVSKFEDTILSLLSNINRVDDFNVIKYSSTHYRLTSGESSCDVWPTTGTYKFKGDTQYYTGINIAIKRLFKSNFGTGRTVLPILEATRDK